MAIQPYTITLDAAEVTPTTITLRPRPSPLAAVVSVVVVLFAAEVTPTTVTLRAPAQDPILWASLSSTLDPATLSSQAGVLVKGSLSQTLDAATLSSQAKAIVGLTLGQTLGAATLVADAHVVTGSAIEASLVATLAPATLTSRAAVYSSGPSWPWGKNPIRPPWEKSLPKRWRIS